MFPMATVFFLQTSTSIKVATGRTGNFPKYFREDPYKNPLKKPPDILLNNYETARPLPTQILLQKDNYAPDFHHFMENRYRSLWAKHERNLEINREVDDFKEQGELTITSQVQQEVSQQGELEIPIFSRLNPLRASHLATLSYLDERLSIAFKSTIKKGDINEKLFPIIFDTGCSHSMTFCKDDFHPPPMMGKFGTVQTADGILNVSGLGMVHWKVLDSTGNEQIIEVPAHYIEGGHKIRLFSPQSYCRYHQMPSDQDAGGYNGTGAWMKIADSESRVFASSDALTVVPMFLATNAMSKKSCQPSCGCKGACSHQASLITSQVLRDENINLSRSQKELLLDHYRLGHLNMSHLQELYRAKSEKELSLVPCLSAKLPSMLGCEIPHCQACRISKAKRRSLGTKKTQDVPERKHVLSTGDLQPGDRCSVDQYESSVQGRLSSSAGKESSKSQYCGGTLFVDHASSKIFTYHQRSLAASDTIIAKRHMEQDALSCGVTIKNFQTDNGVFKSKAFEFALQNGLQTIKFSGVGAHHQNGRAERAIQTVQNMTRSMLLHAALNWKDMYNSNLWPFALTHATHIYNNTPQLDLNWRSPMEIFCGTIINCTYLRRLRVWGCPVFVLEPRLQDGRKIPKWEPKARMGQNLGYSEAHSSSINLIRNLRTERVSPQYHVVYDELFTTVVQEEIKDPDSLWENLFTNSRDHILDEQESGTSIDTMPDLHEDWLPENERTTNTRRNELPPHPSTILHEERGERVDRTSTIEDFENPSTSTDTLEEFEGGFRSEPSTTSISDDTSDMQVEPSPDARDYTRTVSREVRIQDEFRPSTRSQTRELRRETSPSTRTSENMENTRGQSSRPSNSNTRGENLSRIRTEGGNPLQRENTPGPISQEPEVRRNPRRSARDRDFRGRSMSLFKNENEHILRPTKIKINTKYSKYVNFLNQLDWEFQSEDPIDKIYDSLMELCTHPITKEIYYEHPLSFIAKVNNQDSPTLQDILRLPEGPEKAAWFEAMNLELDGLLAKRTFKLVQREVALKAGKQIVPTMWIFKVKRRPDGKIIKYKARLVVRGDRQDLTEEIGGDDTYAPVVEWGTVRMSFSCCVQFKLASRSIDFDNAFVQSSLPEPIHIELPQGGYKENYPGMILQVDKSLYGDRRAPKLWYNHLRGYLLKEGFEVSPIDPCLFLRENLSIIVYVDDAILMSKDDITIDKFLDKMTKDNFEFTVDGDFASYLGVTVNFLKDGSIKLTQEHLTNQVIELLGLQDAVTKPTPSTSILGKNLENPPASGEFNYRSALGMMQYLCNNTRPDCTFAISQCARFSNNPKDIHEIAVKRIGRYLLGTKDAGIIFQTSVKPTLDMYVDADFAGLWSYEDLQDSDCVRSRSGHVIFLGNSPVIWKSKLQTEIASSTMESEYIALSQGMKQLIPLRVTYKAFLDNFKINLDGLSTISTVFEDNQAARILATHTDPPRLTPRSKSIAVKYHWFRQFLGIDTIIVKDINTKLQKANILTKPLTAVNFQQERQMLMGWSPI